MECREKYEQEVDLRDLLFHMLYRWRSVVLAAALACGLAAGYAVLQNKAVLPEKRAHIQEQLEGQESLLGALAEGQSAEPIQKEITRLKEELEGLEELSYGKYSLLGLGGGLFALILCYGISYICSDKLRGERELRERYGYFLLGTLPRKKRNGFLKVIDEQLEKWEGTAGQITREEAYWIISINIINLAKTGGTFLVTGTVEEEKLREVTDVLSSQVENVTIVSGTDMNRTASTLEALAECDAVILVEERGESLRANIHREQESIEALEKPVVGYVLL